MTADAAVLDVAGTRVWYEDHSAGTRGTDVTLLLLHAAGADSSMWDTTLPALGGDHRVVRLDFPGSGRSPRPTAPVDLVRLTGELLDRLGVTRAVLAGVSMGGTVALDLAVERPDLVLGVLGMSCAGHDHLGDEAADYPGIGVFSALASGDRAAAVQRYLDLWCGSRATPESDAQVRQQVEANIDSLLLTLGGLLVLPTWPTDERLGRLAVPTQLVYGEDDDPALWRSGLRLAATIPGCRATLMSGTDHFVPLRRPYECARLLRSLVDSVRTPADPATRWRQGRR